MTDNEGKMIRVLVVDDYPIVRAGLLSMINGQSDMVVVAEAANGQEAIELFEKHQPDITLMDLRMPVMKGVEAIDVIRRGFPQSRIIVLTGSGNDEDIYRTLRAGVRSFVWKSLPQDQLLDAIRVVHSGGRLIPKMIAKRFAERIPAANLSRRELDILELIINGGSNKHIAASLKIKEGTVKQHVVKIMRKLGAADETEAATKALNQGFIRFE